jgi:hypothetical protein
VLTTNTPNTPTFSIRLAESPLSTTAATPPEVRYADNRLVQAHRRVERARVEVANARARLGRAVDHVEAGEFRPAPECVGQEVVLEVRGKRHLAVYLGSYHLLGTAVMTGKETRVVAGRVYDIARLSDVDAVRSPRHAAFAIPTGSHASTEYWTKVLVLPRTGVRAKVVEGGALRRARDHLEMLRKWAHEERSYFGRLAVRGLAAEATSLGLPVRLDDDELHLSACTPAQLAEWLTLLGQRTVDPQHVRYALRAGDARDVLEARGLLRA